MYFSREIESSPKNESNPMEADVNGQCIVGLIYQNGNKVDAIETLIKRGANLAVQNTRGEIPLDIAIIEGKVEVAKL
ncbi:MAG: ankyrin repeat domain-containing protein [Wolbachia endosymbiont of Fragariocoptes setiger]|nr:ankyrin repeat domain-containing protein [Wolbachia endosymbiont of Fragariocoptes setiger]